MAASKSTYLLDQILEEVDRMDSKVLSPKGKSVTWSKINLVPKGWLIIIIFLSRGTPPLWRDLPLDIWNDRYFHGINHLCTGTNPSTVMNAQVKWSIIENAFLKERKLSLGGMKDKRIQSGLEWNNF